jgi:hypothetical protein
MLPLPVLITGLMRVGLLTGVEYVAAFVCALELKKMITAVKEMPIFPE